jgi:Flp pilus assembly protein TadD
LSRAAELVPQASEIQNHLGLAYWAEGQPEEARLAFDRAIALDCDNIAARQNRKALEEGAAHGG